METGVGCGVSSSESSENSVFVPGTQVASYDAHLCSWRTSQLCLPLYGMSVGESSNLQELAEYLETWPRSGMTRSGIAFRRPELGPITCGTGRGLLPTPAKRDFRDVSSTRAYSSQRRRHSPSLATVCLEAGALFTQLYSAYRIAMGYPSGWCDALFSRSVTP